jgi:uncharacterized protein YjbI with pentapeptide repeats
MAGRNRSKVQKISQDELEVILAEHDKWLMYQARLSVSITGSKEFRDLKYFGGDVFEKVAIFKEVNEWARIADRQAEGSCADLSYTDLSGLNLSHKDLSEASLRGAKLHYTNFERAILRHTNLAEADLRHARLSGAHLPKANLSDSDLREANFHSAYLEGADLSRADLRHAKLYATHLMKAVIVQAKLQEVSLSGANLEKAILHSSDLSGADLRGALLLNCDLRKANLTNCEVFGVSAWNVNLDGAIESQLRITDRFESEIMVDSLEVAQFIYLLLNNERIRQVIDTVTSKVVLILGRFKPDRKKVLDAIREKLLEMNYVPILFDFKKSPGLDFTETITLLARMARFIIADLTEPSSIPQELQAIVPDIAVPVQPILEGKKPYSMFSDYHKYDWMLKLHRYNGLDELLASLPDKVIAPAEAKRKDLTERKSEPLE